MGPYGLLLRRYDSHHLVTIGIDYVLCHAARFYLRKDVLTLGRRRFDETWSSVAFIVDESTSASDIRFDKDDFLPGRRFIPSF